MQPHQQRVIDEKQELDDKIEKLTAFISFSDIFKELPGMDQLLLHDQLTHMCNYSLTLEKRITRF